jgi:hypothetical protein
MAVINHKYRFVFLAEPYTGSRAVRDALCGLDGSVETNGDHHLGLRGCVDGGWLSHNEAEAYTVFSTIRDPHDILVSRWLYHNHQRSFFDVFVAKARRSEQTTYSGDLKPTLFWRTAEQVDWFIRYETLHAALNVLLAHLGAPVIKELPVVGRSLDKPDWRDMWDMSLEAYARKFFPDIRRYDYRAFHPAGGWAPCRRRPSWLVRPKRGD